MAQAGFVRQMMKLLGGHHGSRMVPQRVRAERSRRNERLPEDEQDHPAFMVALLVSTTLAAAYILFQA